MPVPATSRSRATSASGAGRFLALLSSLTGSRSVLVEPDEVGSRPVLLPLLRRPPRGRYLVISWGGARAAWFRAAQVRGRVRVGVGGAEPVPATARVLGPAEVAAILRRFRRERPRAVGGLSRLSRALFPEGDGGLPVVELVPDFGG